MAKVSKITPEGIELYRGKIDFYMLRGILPVARSWPKKPKPPYTPLQAEGMEAFSIANKSMREITPNMLEAWRSGSVGKKAAWTDVYRSIIMKYWKKYKSIPPIAIDYEIVDSGATFIVYWDILQRSLKDDPPEERYRMQSSIIDKIDIEKAPKPIFFTLLNDLKERLVAPYIMLEV